VVECELILNVLKTAARTVGMTAYILTDIDAPQLLQHIGCSMMLCRLLLSSIAVLHPRILCMQKGGSLQHAFTNCSFHSAVYYIPPKGGEYQPTKENIVSCILLQGVKLNTTSGDELMT